MRAVRLVSAGVDDVAGRPVRPAELAGAERDAVGGRELEMRHAMTLHTEDYCPGAASVATPNVSSTQTVILPVVTETIKDETVERPAVTVTLAGTTTTVAAGASTTVVTVTGPNKAVHECVLASKHGSVTVTTPRRVVRVHARVVRVLGRGRGKNLIVVVVRSNGCPAGTALSHGVCRGVVRGKG